MLGLFVVICLAMATPANAGSKRLWNLASKGNVKMYLSVYGGQQCQDRICSLPKGAGVILWERSGGDQSWILPAISNPRLPTQGAIQNNLSSSYGQLFLSVYAGSTSEGAVTLVWTKGAPPDFSADQYWRLESKNVPFTDTYKCYVITNVKSGMVLSVSNGWISNGAQVVQWPLQKGTEGSLTGWHLDQFWCLEDV